MKKQLIICLGLLGHMTTKPTGTPTSNSIEESREVISKSQPSTPQQPKTTALTIIQEPATTTTQTISPIITLTGDGWYDKYALLQRYQKTVNPNIPTELADKISYLGNAESWLRTSHPTIAGKLFNVEKTPQSLAYEYGKAVKMPGSLTIFIPADLEKPTRPIRLPLVQKLASHETIVKEELAEITKIVNSIESIHQFKQKQPALSTRLNTIQLHQNSLSHGPTKNIVFGITTALSSLITAFGQDKLPKFNRINKISKAFNAVSDEDELPSYISQLVQAVNLLLIRLNSDLHYESALALLTTTAKALQDTSGEPFTKNIAEGLDLIASGITKAITLMKTSNSLVNNSSLSELLNDMTRFAEVSAFVAELPKHINHTDRSSVEKTLNTVKQATTKSTRQNDVKIFKHLNSGFVSILQQALKAAPEPIKEVKKTKPAASSDNDPLLQQIKAALAQEIPTTPSRKISREELQKKVAAKKALGLPTTSTEATEKVLLSIAAAPEAAGKEQMVASAKFVGKKQYLTLADWKDARTKLPTYRTINPALNDHNAPLDYPDTLLTKNEYLRILNDYLAIRKNSLQKSPWLEKTDDKLYDINDADFRPFAQKITLPENSLVALFGDIHGDLHSFITYLAHLEKLGYLDTNLKLKKNVFLVFLGDYVDRGLYGAEVMALMMSLYNNNPQQVIPVRGNHEDYAMNHEYGFRTELQKKFGYDKNLNFLTYKVHDLLPVVLLLGSGSTSKGYWYAECAHGSFELGHSLKNLLTSAQVNAYSAITSLDRTAQANVIKKLVPDAIKQKITELAAGDLEGFPMAAMPSMQKLSPGQIGFGYMWGDFFFGTGDGFDYSPLSGRIMWGPSITHAKFITDSAPKHRIVGMFRAHQHSSTTVPNYLVQHGGLYQHFSPNQWSKMPKQPLSLDPGFVVTFNLTPDSLYGTMFGNFINATMGLLTVKEDFKQTTLIPEQFIVPQK